MKFNVRRDIEVDTLRMDLAVRYDDEDMPYEFPFRTGDRWKVDVDLATHRIKDWPGLRANVNMKVCDEGVIGFGNGPKLVAAELARRLANGLVLPERLAVTTFIPSAWPCVEVLLPRVDEVVRSR